MNKSLKVMFNIFVFSLVISGFIIAHKGTASAYTFLPSNLVSDTVFERSNSMSSADINTFLNSFAASCISTNNGFTTPLPLGWSDAQNKYIFGANVSAGEAIYAVSQLYHVNPQVVLATLQKEQSIPTGSAGCHPSSPDPNAPFSAVPAVNTTFTCTIGGRSRTCTYACSFAGGCMNIAVGYDCPGYCNAANEGFSRQITLGTWLLRFAEQRSKGIMGGYVGYEAGDDTLCYSGPMTPGTRQRSQVNTACNAIVTYDGSYTTLDGVSVTVASGGTAALYNFTPFVSGNHNFDNIFNGWFGPSTLINGSITLSKALTLSKQTNVFVGDQITASYEVDNSAGISIDAGGFGICARLDGRNYDFGFIDHQIIPANSIVPISFTKTINNSGSLFIFVCAYSENMGGWVSNIYPYDLMGTMTRQTTMTVQDNPLVTAGIGLSPASPSIGQSVTATFTLRNAGSTPVNIGSMIVSARDPLGRNVDFPIDNDVTIAPNGGTYTYSKVRTFTTPGVYSLSMANWNGVWSTTYPKSLDGSIARQLNMTVN